MTRVHQGVLMVSGVIAMALGVAILFAPQAMHDANDVDLGTNASLLSEIRAPGAALIAFGGLLIAGAVVARLAFAATLSGAVVYLAYGVGRLVSVAVDGMPSATLIGATIAEFVIGGALVAVLVRSRARPTP